MYSALICPAKVVSWLNCYWSQPLLKPSRTSSFWTASAATHWCSSLHARSATQSLLLDSLAHSLSSSFLAQPLTCGSWCGPLERWLLQRRSSCLELRAWGTIILKAFRSLVLAAYEKLSGMTEVSSNELSSLLLGFWFLTFFGTNIGAKEWEGVFLLRLWLHAARAMIC